MPSRNIETVHREVIQALRQERLRKGFSKNRLAQEAGVSHQMVGYIESGERFPTLDMLLRIASALEVDLGKVVSEAGGFAQRASGEGHLPAKPGAAARISVSLAGAMAATLHERERAAESLREALVAAGLSAEECECALRDFREICAETESLSSARSHERARKAFSNEDKQKPSGARA